MKPALLHPTLLLLTVLAAILGRPVQAQPALELDPGKAITQYLHDVWTRDDGLPQNRVNVVLQTRDGYLWLGTQEGLVRFDGIDFSIYNPANSELEGTTITALHEDHRGRLWVGTREGGVSYLADGTFVTLRQQDGLNSDHVSAIAEDADGNLWVGTTLSGLNRITPDTILSYRAPDELPSDAINTLRADHSGNLWIGTRDAGLIRFGDDHFTHFTDRAGFPATDVLTIFQDQQGMLWFGTRDQGLVRLRSGAFTTFTRADGLPTNTVLAIEEDAAGSLWIGTERGGLARMRDERFEAFGEDEGLTSHSVLSLEEDTEGSLWLATRTGGLNRLRDGKVKTYTTREGLTHNAIYSVHQDQAGRTWIGTGGGGVNWLTPSGEAHALTTEDGLPSDFVISTLSTRDGSVWFGTPDKGLARLRNGRITTYDENGGLPGQSVYALFEDSAGHLWIGTGRNGLARFHDGHFESYTHDEGLSSDAITTITEGRDGSLWVGTYDGGLNQLRDGHVVAQYTDEDGLGSNTILSLHEDGRGNLWIGTRGGLSRLRDGRIATVTTADGLFNDKVMTLLEDASGRLWMSSNRGLFYVRLNELRAFFNGKQPAVTSTVFGKQDGLRTREFNGGTQPAGWAAEDGTLWFPSAEGVVHLDPNHLPINKQPPPVDILAVHAGDTLIDHRQPVELEAGRDKVEIRYAGLSYIAPEETHYQYMLEGVDQGWVDAGTRRAAFYTNLAPGSYTFRVKARNLDGVWSTEDATLSFRLLPFFYQTTWFYVLCMLGLLGLGLMSYRLRVRHLKARQRMLEREVRARTKDLREEKEKTEEAKAVIEEQAERLRAMDRIKTQFFNNISHEFRTPLTLNIGPLENALSGVYGPLNDEMRRQVDIMLRNSRRLLRLINQLLDLSKLDTNKVNLEVQRRDFVGFIQGVVLSFSAFVEKKQLLLELDTDLDALWMYFDPQALEKVFYNLLSNAVKFTPEEGRITVELHPSAENDAVEIAVHDTGCGIPEAELPYVFDRFHQVNGSVSNVQEGTGIGLALVHELVHLHGGTLRVESEEGAGTSFFISLPQDVRRQQPEVVEVEYAEDEQEPLSKGPMIEMAVFDDEVDEQEAGPSVPSEVAGDGLPAEVQLAPQAERATILVVDDNPDIRDYVSGCLHRDYQVLTAENGRLALEQARCHRPDLIVSDVSMPVMTGYELCRRVRADEALQHLPIILLTSRASVDDKLEGLDAGADDYLTKPFNARELTMRVRNLLTLRTHQQDLVDVNEALRDVIDQKTNLLQITAHDIRNPVGSIRELAKMVREEVEANPTTDELLELIETSADQAVQIISQMLEAEALESPELELRREPLDVHEMIEAVLHSNRAQAKRKNQHLDLRVPHGTEALWTHGDRDWLVQAADNLISNAIKYSSYDSPITVELQRHESSVRVVVCDEGPGLSEDDQQMLFKKFQRLTPRPTGGEASTGLGLAIVKQIVDKHDGEVGVESALGQGSRFYFDLPLTEEVAA